MFINVDWAESRLTAAQHSSRGERGKRSFVRGAATTLLRDR